MPAESTDLPPPAGAPAAPVPPASLFEAPSTPDLMGALGRLVRGLAILFWGLPISLVVCVQCAKGDWFRALGALAPLFVTGLLYYGLAQLGHFQRQERIWRAALERAQVLALLNFGLSPFLYWWSRIPTQPFFNAMTQLLMLSALLFLFLLNPLLVRLTAMLPDETLRLETRFFATLNRYILAGIFVLLGGYFILEHLDAGLADRLISWLLRVSPLPARANALLSVAEHLGPWLILFFVLLPLAMTMALLWKIKEVILASVFGPGAGKG